MHGDLLLRNNRCFISPSRSEDDDCLQSRLLALRHQSLQMFGGLILEYKPPLGTLGRLWNILAHKPNCLMPPQCPRERMRGI
jgi:hypothetical protein